MNFRKIASVVLSIGALLTFAPSLPASAADSVLDDPELNDYITAYMDAEHTPGLSLAAVNGDTVYYKNWGYNSIAQQIPATEHTPYELASVSKAFTALSVLLLQEEGKLSVNDSVSDYLTWFDVKWQGERYDLKIWQLLNHTSGIPEKQTLKHTRPGTDEKLKEETARIAEGIDLGFEPGTDYEYCNLNYDILAYLTEVVSGERFEDYVTREIFLPIGMTETGYDIPTAQGYQRCFLHTVEYNAPRFKGCQGDGYVISTAADMSLWIKAQLGQPELPEKLSAAIERSHHPENASQYIKCGEERDGTALYYANGWKLTKDCGYIKHSGGNPNFSTMLCINCKSSTGTFAASNMMSAYSPEMAAKSAYRIMNGEIMNRLPADTSIDTIITPIAAAALLLMTVIFVFLLTQKKRLAKKSVNMKKEKRTLCLRLTVFILLLGVSLTLPYLVGYNYMTAAVWLPHSVLIAFTVIDLDLMLLIVSCIFRYIRQKRKADE